MKRYKTNLDLISLVKSKSDIPRAMITTSKEAADYARQFYFDDISIYESMFLLLLNSKNNTIGYAKISQGGVTGTVADPRIIAKYVADTLAVGAILVHNHPSGNLSPSLSDKKITQKVRDVCGLLDSHLLDHIIITENGHFSFADESLL